MASRIREYRKRAGLTLEELASRIGMTDGNLSKLERGQISYTQYHLETLAREFGCRPVDLISEGGDTGKIDEPLLATVLAAVFERVRDINLRLEPQALAAICTHVYQEAASVEPAGRSAAASERADTVIRYEARRAG
jgi:transcriptional regulator with XRE-family HTH domain